MTDVTELTVGVFGGTGPQGRGLALRWARAGIEVVLGSRSTERAEAAAAALREESGVDRVRGLDNAGCYRLPGMPWLAGRAYKLVARHRGRLSRWGATPACERPGVSCETEYD